MHTVFINTTQNEIGGRFDSLRSAKDLKKMMYVDCPLASWYDEKLGYQYAVQQIAEFIDTYNFVNNDYNLVVYVDMVEIFDLLKIGYFNFDTVKQALLSKILKSAVARLLSSTILSRLVEDGRVPAECPVLLLELPHTEQIPSGIDLEQRKRDAMLKVLGIMPIDILAQVMKSGPDNQVPKIDDIFDKSDKNAKFDLSMVYHERIQILLDSVCKDGVDLKRACDDLYEAIESGFDSDCAKNIAVSEYYTNKRSQRLSLEIYTKHNFLLQCFILDCINEGTAYSGEKNAKHVPDLSDDDWKTILDMLYKKKRVYEVEKKKLENLGDDFTKLGLAPGLFKLARDSFGLNETGSLKNEYVVRKVKPEQKKSVEGDNTSEDDALIEKKSELVEQRGDMIDWLGNSEYEPYDTTGDKYSADISDASPEEYCNRARELANHHLNLFNKLALHVKSVMSNYSGRSLSNAAPVLRKRSVNMGESISDSVKNDYKYAKREGEKLIEEEAPSEIVQDSSMRAYTTVMIQYLKFDADRSVSVRNIKEQCDWFNNRVQQIVDSLNKLFYIFLVMLASVLLLYLPFVFIQSDYIKRNIFTISVAAVSIAAPLILLFCFYFLGRIIHRRKIKKAWKELLNKSQEACEANQRAIAAYDAMMIRYIPALRWIYEYVLDVDFHCDCCAVALSKIAHHNDILLERTETLDNFLEDLDFDEYEYNPPSNSDPVEYTSAFCEGEKNNRFYSIIDNEMLDVINKRKRGLD